MTTLLRDWFQRIARLRNSFAVQLSAVLLVVSLAPVLVYFWASIRTTERAVLEVASQHNMAMLGNQKEYLTLQMEQIEALAANLGQVEEITQTLAKLNEAPFDSAYDELATKARMGYLLSNYRNLKGLVSIDLYSLNGAHYHVGDSLSDANVRTELRDQLLARTFKSSASVVWHGVEDNVQSSSSNPKVLVATKLLMRANSSWLKAEPVGMLVVNYSTDYLHAHFSAMNLGKGAYLLVLDDQHRLIYAPNKSRIGTQLAQSFTQLLSLSADSYLQPIDGQDMLLSYQQIADKRWVMVSLVPKDTLLEPMERIQSMGWLLLAVSVLLVLLFIRLLALRVVQPIGEIATGFRRYQEGRLDPAWRMPLPRSLEQIGELVKWFNAFLDGMEKRRDADVHLRIAATAFESQEGIFVTDAQGVILQANGAFTAITGYTADEVVGRTPKILKSGVHDNNFYARMYTELTGNGAWTGEVWNRRKNGSIYPEWLTVTGVKNENNQFTHYVATMTDITQRKATEEEIRNLAFYDPLTMLPNRRLLTDRLKQAISDSTRRKRCGALMFLDLDKFKVINDTRGHAMGDLLLCRVAQRLAACVREGDTVARLGGDEFVVLLEDLGSSPTDAAGQAESVGLKIVQAMYQPHDLDGEPYQSSVSVGITIFRDAQCPYEELMKQADIALYQSKESGRNTLRFFDPAMQAVVVARAAMDNALREALAQQQFTLHFQPKVDHHRGILGAEALVRWSHPERGIVSPADFIPLAEETGLIVPLGLWVLRSSCETLASWASHPQRAHWVLAVNVSSRQFSQADFVIQVLQILASTGVNPARLRIEITESLLVDNVEDVATKMSQLKSRGVEFSLDDFGTGYSSLAYLKRMPLSEIKIDQSFVHDVMYDPNDATIAKTIIALCHSMGLNVVAEGVETQDQLDFLVNNGCQSFQGYFFSRPLPLAEFESYAEASAT